MREQEKELRDYVEGRTSFGLGKTCILEVIFTLVGNINLFVKIDNDGVYNDVATSGGSTLKGVYSVKGIRDLKEAIILTSTTTLSGKYRKPNIIPFDELDDKLLDVLHCHLIEKKTDLSMLETKKVLKEAKEKQADLVNKAPEEKKPRANRFKTLVRKSNRD